MSNVEPIQAYLEPVRKSVTVARSVDEAFEIFTARITDWWPKHGYSVSQERTQQVVVEPRVGGSVHEIRDDGETFPWGKVLTWEAPRRLVLSWHAGRAPDVAQEVEVTFTAEGDGTRVDLEHRNWQQLGPDAQQVRDGYAGGWERVLGECFAGAC